MDTRISLKNNTVLKPDGGSLSYIVKNEIARGGSCIVYDAVYQLTSGEEKPVRLKECYPFNLNVKRNLDGSLESGQDDVDYFEAIKDGMRKAYYDGSGLFVTSGLTNATSNMLHCFEKNNTVYVPSVFLEGETLSFDTFSSLKDCISIVKTVACVVARIHQAGYLYLDVKPENVFVITNAEGKGATELVQLFDFDSLVAVDSLKNPEKKNFRLSYSQGFAAIEHQMGNIKKLGYYTDVYSVGALLYYLIFGTAPSAFACEEDAVYDYASSKYGDTGYQDRLFFRLDEFFHRTLANYYPDRYQSMDHVVEELKALTSLADTTVAYVYSTSVSQHQAFVGRERELGELQSWLRSENEPCLFLTGMGGIGKSSLMRKFITVQRRYLDTVLYLDYRGNFCDTFVDDFQVQINNVEKNPEETKEDYFLRKVKWLRRLLNGTNSLIVIDNFAGDTKKDFRRVLDIGVKTAVLSRETKSVNSYAHIPLEALEDKKKLYRLFEVYVQRQIAEDEFSCLDSIISHVAGHTLVLELIAKQIRKSYMTIQQAEKLVKESGFTGMASERVPYEKDYETGQETIKNIVSAVFFYKEQDTEKRKLLKAVSMLKSRRASVLVLSEMLKLPTKDGLNELCEEGWLTEDGMNIYMHPVICETVEGWEWLLEYLDCAETMMNYLFKRLKLEGQKERYPLPHLKVNHFLRDTTEKNAFLKKWTEKRVAKMGITGEIWKERVSRGKDETPSDPEKVKMLLELSEGVLESCQGIEALREKDIYVNLMGTALANMPREKEEFIIRHTEELIQHTACNNGYMIMRLYKNLVSIYNERMDFETAENLLNRIKKFIRGYDHYVNAQYYDILADFYDARLGGQYNLDNEYGDLESLKKAVDKSIASVKKVHGKYHADFMIQLLLGKVNIMIRSTPEKKKEIMHLLRHLKELIEKNTQCYSRDRVDYAMSCAWYYTLSDPEEDAVEKFCEAAKKIAEKTCTTGLDYIDVILIPHANMLTEFGDFDRASQIVYEGIEKCSHSPEMAAYIRKKMDLYGYLLEIYYYAGDPNRSREIARLIEQENEQNELKGIRKEIPEEIQQFMQQ